MSSAMTRICLGLMLCAAANAEVPPQALTPPLPAQPGTQAVTMQWLLQADRAIPSFGGAFQWLGQRPVLMYDTVTSGPSARSRIETLDVSSGATKVLSDGMRPRAAPDGSRIAFFRSTSEEGLQLWVMAADGSGARALSRFGEGTLKGMGHEYGFAWAPDSRRILLFRSAPYVTPFLAAPETRSDEATTAIVADAPDTKPPDNELWIFDAGNGQSRRIASVGGVIRFLTWLGDGDEVLVASIFYDYLYRDGRGTRTLLQAVDAGTGTLREIMVLPSARQRLGLPLSPDGRTMALVMDAQNGEDMVRNLHTLAVEGDFAKPPRQLTHDAKFLSPQWSGDGRHVYARRSYGIYEQLYRVDAVTGELDQVTSMPASVLDYALAADGRLAMRTRNAHDRIALWVGRVGEDGRAADMKEVRVVGQPPAQLSLGEVREVEWRADDGVTLRGGLVLPPGFVPGKRYPAVLDLHGGTVGTGVSVMAGAFVYDTPLEHQLWAAKGYVVFLPDWRSSGAYGLKPLQEMQRRHDIMWHANEGDILSGIDHLAREGVIDPDRVALVGMSGGASHAAWLVARTRNRFRAAVSVDGHCEEYLHGITGGLIGGAATYYHDVLGGWPWEVPQRYWDNSALAHVKGATTPTLFLMGSIDSGSADWVNGCQALYTALKRQGVDARYVRYVGEGHGFRRPANRRDAFERGIEWVDRYMGDSSYSD